MHVMLIVKHVTFHINSRTLSIIQRRCMMMVVIRLWIITNSARHLLTVDYVKELYLFTGKHIACSSNTVVNTSMFFTIMVTSCL